MPTKLQEGDLREARMAIYEAQRHHRSHIERLAGMNLQPGGAIYSSEDRARDDLEAKAAIAALDRVADWLMEREFQAKERELQAKARRQFKSARSAERAYEELEKLTSSTVDQIFGARTRAAIDAVAGKERCECGAKLAHVEGAGVSGVLCTECDAEHLSELTEAP
jgi:hypothetical protein